MSVSAEMGHLPIVRLLVQQGADQYATSHAGHTAAASATAAGHNHIATWLERSVGWAPIHHACDGRLGVRQLVALLQAGADPSLPSPQGETPLDISKLTDATQGALPNDKAMTKLLEQALRPWHWKRHILFPRSFTPRVVLLLLIHQRLERRAAQFERHGRLRRVTRSGRRLGAVLLMRLSREELLMIVPFLPRFGHTEAARPAE